MSPLQRTRRGWSKPGLRVGAACLILLLAMLAGWAYFARRASLDITPTVFSECKGPNVVVHVKWDASSVTKKPVYLLVHKPGQAPSVWLMAAPKGEADTGKWASDGWTVALADSRHRRLAKRTLETVPCDASGR